MKQKTWGWRHFQVVNRQNRGQWVFAELVASCDPTVRFWINANRACCARLSPCAAARRGVYVREV